MRRNKMFLLVIMILPWLSLQLLGKKAIQRFYPGALFIFFLVLVESIFVKKRVWWRFFEKLLPNVMGELPFLFGPLFVGALWILKFSFGNFLRYIILNVVTNLLIAYPGMSILRKMGIVSLVRLKHYQMGVLLMAQSVLMYIVQIVAEKNRKTPKSLIQRMFS